MNIETSKPIADATKFQRFLLSFCKIRKASLNQSNDLCIAYKTLFGVDYVICYMSGVLPVFRVDINMPDIEPLKGESNEY